MRIFRYPDIRMVKIISSRQGIIHVKFELPSFQNEASRAKNRMDFFFGYPDIRIAKNIRTHEVIIHVKFQLDSLKTVAVMRRQTPSQTTCKYIFRCV